MNENKQKPTIIHAGWSGFWITLGLWSIFFWGEPDLRTVLIEFLQRAGYN